MRHIHQREPGAVIALLLAEQVSVELIVDGNHLHPGIIDLAMHCKTKEKIFLVSDAMRAKCLGDGQFTLGGQTVHVQAGKATLADGTLAGSTLSLPQAIKNMTQLTSCSLVDAILMATKNPATYLGLGGHKGEIVLGAIGYAKSKNPLLLIGVPILVIFTAGMFQYIGG